MSGDMAAPKKRRPSERWASFDDWNYGGMRQRLEGFMASINKTALAEHASAVLGSPASMSEPFSAGQYWCCFELVAPDDRLLVARVRLPKHPESNARRGRGVLDPMRSCDDGVPAGECQDRPVT